MSRVAREILEAVILALVVFLVIQTSVRNFRVEGSSMNPTLEGGQYLLVNKLVYAQIDMERLSRIVPFWKVDKPSERFAIHPPRRGEVVVFHYPMDPTRDFVKRVVGLPGDTVALRNGVVYINGNALEEPYLDARDNSDMAPVHLGEKEYFVLGDNRRSSNDSRAWGPLHEKYLLGKVWFVYWPFSDWHLLNSFTPLAGRLLP